ncbi:MAG: urease accessory protein UreD [Spirochaetaceae bacterium]|jgi:urease accessory protein|nr:urease accessory protein UreD [Spirochaetaceae bacterium]
MSVSTTESLKAGAAVDEDLLNKGSSSRVMVTESLNNRVEIQQIQGKNRVTQLVYGAPLRIFQLGSPSVKEPVNLMFSNYGGGMLQGDHISLDIRCQKNSAMVLQSQANSHIFKNENLRDAEFHVNAHLDAGSSVIIRPEPVVLHGGARFSQKQRWNLREGAKLLLVDWIQSGRSDSGESFLFHSFHSDLEIRQEGKILLKERFRCEPHQDDPHSYASFMGLDHMVNVYFIGYSSVPEEIMALKQKEGKRIYPLLDEESIPPQPLQMAITSLGDQQGFVLRMLAKSRLNLQAPLNKLQEFFTLL